MANFNLEEAPIPDWIGDYNLRSKSIWFKNKNLEYKVCEGTIWLAAAVHDEEKDLRSYLVAGVCPMGRRFNDRIPAEKLMKDADLAKFLAQKGLVIEDTKSIRSFISKQIRSLAQQNNGTNLLRLIKNRNWYEENQLLFDGNRVHTADGSKVASKYYFEPQRRPLISSAGTLNGWEAEVLPLVWANTVPLVQMCVALLSPFLPMFGDQGSRMINWHGLKGTGKTLGLQAAASLFGNGVDPAAGSTGPVPPYVQKFKATANAIETLFTGVSPFPALLDELSEVKEISNVADMIYAMSSGQGKRRMLSDGEAAPDNLWLQTVQTSSEHSISARAAKAGKPLNGGEVDRAIDIGTDALIILSDFGKHGTFGGAAKHLKHACAEHYGTAGPAVIKFYLDHPKRCAKFFKMLPEAEAVLTPEGCGAGETRVVRFLAAAYCIGLLAIKAGVFPDEPERLEDAFAKVVDAWWTARTPELSGLLDFLKSSRRIEKEPNLDDRRCVFIHGDYVTVPEHLFEVKFGDESRSMLKQLFHLGLLHREQPGRNLTRYCNGRFEGYCFFRSKLKLGAIAGTYSAPRY